MYNVVILDNGHGKETPGKRSPVWPDNTQLFEYEFNRDIVKRISQKLLEKGIPFHILTPEQTDVPLTSRVKRANSLFKKYDNKAFLISIHANAGGGTGWEAYTSKGQTKSDKIATELYRQAEIVFPNAKMRKDLSDGDADKEADFYILKHTFCPAVLTENFFMDYYPDCRLIMSDEGRNKVAQLHTNAIISLFKAQ